MQLTALRFDRYILDLERGALLLDGSELALRPKTFAVLKYLAEHAGRLVSKDELFAAAWPDVTVTDDALVQSIGELRRALGDDGARLIKTIPRRGYRFEADVLPDAPPPEGMPSSSVPPSPPPEVRKPRASFASAIGGRWAALVALIILVSAGALWASGVMHGVLQRADRAPAATQKVGSIAVLPFVNQGNDPAEGVFRRRTDAGHHQRARPLSRIDRDVVERGAALQGQAE
jgi:DNA-binding winged helix-turn-helix (wHTH) protein